MRRPTALALAALVLVATACSGGNDEAAPERSPEPAGASSTTAVVVAPDLPLLGLGGERVERAALVVKLDNAPLGRPQAGINNADVVVEEAIEGGITRLFAVFHSTEADVVGPVRSARSTDVTLAAALGRPLFAYSGANGAFLELVRSSPVVDRGADVLAGAYRRERGRRAPYDLFSSTAALREGVEAGTSPGPLFVYRGDGAPLVAAGAEPATPVQITFPGRSATEAGWEWDADGRTWARTQNGTPHVDADRGRVAPVNVVIQFTSYRDTELLDQSGAAVPEAELVGEGDAWVLTDGQVVVGRWRRPSPEVATEYLDADGRPITLTPGRTWVELAPPGSATK